MIDCEAIGKPTPLIVWRLNWGHIGAAPRVTTTSVNGRGVLTIRRATKEDEGAYTCEAINTKGSIFAQPDTILIVSRKYCVKDKKGRWMEWKGMGIEKGIDQIL